ncbi:hypothetical protein AD998_08550 [bacterium 336/3]|nr:hypothetical protein AD998_08550 [bacterium 336/3]
MQNKEFENIVDLICSRDKSNVALGLSLAQNYPIYFKEHFGYNYEDAKEWIEWLSDSKLFFYKGALDYLLKNK